MAQAQGHTAKYMGLSLNTDLAEPHTHTFHSGVLSKAKLLSELSIPRRHRCVLFLTEQDKPKLTAEVSVPDLSNDITSGSHRVSLTRASSSIPECLGSCP